HAEDAHEGHGDEAEDRKVVDDEAEEAVEVAGDEPARRGAGGSRGHAVWILGVSGSGRNAKARGRVHGPRPTRCPSPRLRGKAGRGGNARITSLTGCPHPTLPRTRGREGRVEWRDVHAGEGVMRGVEGLARFLRRGRHLPPLAGAGWEWGHAQIASLAGCPHPNPAPQAGAGACCPAYPSPREAPSSASGRGR